MQIRETSRETRTRQVKETILDAAIQVFAAKGFDGSTIGEIAALSGAKQPLIVYHFANKETLWEQAANRLMAKFDAAQEIYYRREPAAANDRERLALALKSFIYTLRDLPEYGKLLLQEGSHPSPRTRWIDHHYNPKIYQNTRFEDPAVKRLLNTVNVLRYAMAGAAVFVVVAGPQIAMSAAETGGGSDSPKELYPLSDALATRLTDMLVEFVFHQMDIDSAAKPKPKKKKTQR